MNARPDHCACGFKLWRICPVYLFVAALGFIWIGLIVGENLR